MGVKKSGDLFVWDYGYKVVFSINGMDNLNTKGVNNH